VICRKKNTRVGRESGEAVHVSDGNYECDF